MLTILRRLPVLQTTVQLIQQMAAQSIVAQGWWEMRGELLRIGLPWIPLNCLGLKCIGFLWIASDHLELLSIIEYPWDICPIQQPKNCAGCVRKSSLDAFCDLKVARDGSQKFFRRVLRPKRCARRFAKVFSTHFASEMRGKKRKNQFLPRVPKDALINNYNDMFCFEFQI